MDRKVYIADIDSLDTDGISQGHYVQVFNDYRTILSKSAEVFIAGGKVFSQYFSDGFICLPTCADRKSMRVINKIRNLLNLRLLFQIAGKDTIIFQSSALPMVYLGILLWAKREGRVFTIQYSSRHGGGNAWISRLLYKLVARKITGNLCTSNATGLALQRPYVVVPDYIYTSRWRDISRGPFSFDFAVVGIISRAKGTLGAVHALAGTNRSLIVAGRCLDVELDGEIRSVASVSPNVEYRPGYLGEDELKRIFMTSRYAILNYSDDYSEHSSGIVFDALFNGCPLVARRCKSLKFVEDYGLGLLYSEIDEVDFNKLLNRDQISIYENNINKYVAENAKSAEKLADFIANT